MELTKSQEKALSLIKNWFLSPQGDKKYFILAGVAGSGKTSIINFLLNELNIDSNNFATATFTGKAALVLNSKGVKAITIHKLIYRPIEKQLESGKMEIIFKRRELSELSFLKLIIIDEASMVSKDIFDDLLLFNIPIIFVGDHQQLPPINNDFNIMLSPDFILTEIHRQALDNPIIYVSQEIIKNGFIKKGGYGSNVLIINSDEINDLPELYFKADQILCGKNSTRQNINNDSRKIFKKTGLLDIGEKIICKKNNWGRILGANNLFDLRKKVLYDLENNFDTKPQFDIDKLFNTSEIPLVNGMIGYVTSFSDVNSFINKELNEEFGKLSFKPDFSESEFEIFEDLIYLKSSVRDMLGYNNNCIRNLINQYLSDNEKPQENFLELGNNLKDKIMLSNLDLNYFNYGYAITVHAAQGSQWKKLLVVEERLGDKDFHKRWLYTACTRAEEKLIILTTE